MIDVKLPILLDSQLRQIGLLHPSNMKITTSLIPISTASLELPLDEIVEIGQFVHLYTSAGDEGIYRVQTVNTRYGEKPCRTVDLQHAISTLSDGYFVETKDYNHTPEQVLTNILSKQKQKLWQLGTVAPTEILHYTRSTGTYLDCIVELVESYHNKYMLSYDFTTTPWAVSLVETQQTPSCQCRLSRNLESVDITLDRTDMFTRLFIPDWGADENGNRRTGKDIKRIEKNVSVWGYVDGQYSDASAIDDNQLLKNAQAYLDQVCNPIITIELDAYELAQLTGESIDFFGIGRMCCVALPDYGVISNERITEISRDDVFGDTMSVKITLANRVQDASTGLTKIADDADKGIKSGRGGRAKSGCYRTAESAMRGLGFLDLTVHQGFEAFGESVDGLAGLLVKNGTFTAYVQKGNDDVKASLQLYVDDTVGGIAEIKADLIDLAASMTATKGSISVGRTMYFGNDGNHFIEPTGKAYLGQLILDETQTITAYGKVWDSKTLDIVTSFTQALTWGASCTVGSRTFIASSVGSETTIIPDYGAVRTFNT